MYSLTNALLLSARVEDPSLLVTSVLELVLALLLVLLDLELMLFDRKGRSFNSVDVLIRIKARRNPREGESLKS